MIQTEQTGRALTAEPAPPAAPTRVLVVDRHGVVRAGLQSLVDGEHDLRLVGQAASAEDALRLVARRAPDVVVMDIGMPGVGGVQAIARIRRIRQDARVLILSMEDGSAYVRGAFEQGADGYLLKEAAAAEVITAIRTVAAGGRYLHPSLGARLVLPQVDPPAGNGQLSAREREVLTLIARGHTNHEIATRLFVSVRTVEAHRSHILTKLGLATRADLVRYALGAGMLDGRE